MASLIYIYELTQNKHSIGGEGGGRGGRVCFILGGGMQKIWGLKKLIDKDISKTYIFLFGRVLKIVLVGRGGGG